MNENEKVKRKLNIKKILRLAFLVVLFILMIIMISLYIAKDNFRKWTDENIFRKEVSNEDAITVDLDTNKKNQIYAYSEYIAVFNPKQISLYNVNGICENTIDVDINKALFDSSEKYLVIAEDGGKNFCLIFDKTYLWAGSEDGQIIQVSVNRNGYVAVVTTDNTYKSIVSVYNYSGKLLFRRYFASTRVVDLSISKDNKYVAIGELDSSGALIQSNLKIISIEKAQNTEEEGIIYDYDVKEGDLLTQVIYKANGNVSCMFSDKIGVISEKEYKEILEAKEKSATFLSNNLNDDIVYVEEVKNGVFSKKSVIHIVNEGDQKEKIYQLEELAKDLKAEGKIIAVNVGTDVYFLNSTGWLIKKFASNQEITNICFSDSIAGIIYRDRVEIINL